MNTGRFAISLHLLTLLNKFPEDVLSSEYLAGSININAVLVRKELSNLKRHGLVDSREGKNGGAFLAKPARQILLSDVYEAVRETSFLGKSKNTPNPKCVVGKEINKHLDRLYDDVEEALIAKLGKTTLADFSKKFG